VLRSENKRQILKMSPISARPSVFAYLDRSPENEVTILLKTMLFIYGSANQQVESISSRTHQASTNSGIVDG